MCSEENSENMQAVKAKSPLEVFEFPEPPKEPPIGPLYGTPNYVGPLKQPLKDPPIKPLRKTIIRYRQPKIILHDTITKIDSPYCLHHN